MPRGDNKQLVRSYIESVINTGFVAEIERFISPDYVEVFEGKRYALGIDGAREHVLGARQTYPDLTLAIERQIAEGDWVVTMYVARGTHTGTWMDIKPTGKMMTYYGVNIDRIVDGRIVEHGGAANMMGPLLEAGALRIVKAE